MKSYVGVAMVGCLALACSGKQTKPSYDPDYPRTSAFQESEERMVPASGAGDEDTVIYESVEEVEVVPAPTDPLAAPMQQGDSVADQRTTQKIREALQNDDSLSFAAKNVKVITLNERVTLRGSVPSMAESQRVEAYAKQVAGYDKVTNQLAIEP